MKSAIPPELEAEVCRRFHTLGDQATATWLQGSHGIAVSRHAVRRCAERVARRGFQPGPDLDPADPGELPDEPTAEQVLHYWYARAQQEARAAEKAAYTDANSWRRFHSALRLIPAYDAAMLRREVAARATAALDQRPQLTPDEEAAVAEAVRRRTAETYGLDPAPAAAPAAAPSPAATPPASPSPAQGKP